MRVLDRDTIDDFVDPAAHDGNVLADAFVGLDGFGRFEKVVGAPGRCGDAVAPAVREIERCLIGLAQPHLGRALRPMRDRQRDHRFGQRVAALHPGGLQIVHVPTFQKSESAGAGRTPCRSSFQALIVARQTIVWVGRTSPKRRSSRA